MYFPNFLASLLSCVRTRLCSEDGVAFLAPQQVPGDHGRLFGLALWPEAVQLGESLSCSCDSAASNGQLWFKLIIPPGFAISAFTLQHEFSLWDSTAETKGGSTLYPTTEKGLLQVSYLSRVVSIMQLPLPLQVTKPTSFLPCFTLEMLQHYLNFPSFTNEVSVLSAETILTKVCQESGWVSGPVLHVSGS